MAAFYHQGFDMLDLSPIFEEMVKGVENGSERFEVMDEDHIKDLTTGLEYHLYDAHTGEPHKITRDGVTIINALYITPKEGQWLLRIKKALSEHFAQIKRAELMKVYNEFKEPSIKGKLNIKKK